MNRSWRLLRSVTVKHKIGGASTGLRDTELFQRITDKLQSLRSVEDIGPVWKPERGKYRGIQNNGILFNEEPIALGQRRKRHVWECSFYTWMIAAPLAILAVGHFVPESSVLLWSQEEAMERMAIAQIKDVKERQ